MARLLFLTTLLAAVVCAADGADDKNKISLSVSFSCDATCEHCYDSIYAFTPGGQDDCQEDGDDFSYKATCAAENGVWTLKTYRGKGCANGKEVYSFGGENQDTCAAAKHTNVKIASIDNENVKFTICPLKGDKDCAEAEADPTAAGCSTETIAPGTCTKGTGDYYYTVEVKGSKASIAVFSTKAECDNKLLPLTRIIEQAVGTCVSHEHRVRGACEIITTTETTTTETTTTEATTTETTTSETTTSGTTTSGTTTTEATTTGTTISGTTISGTTSTGTTSTGTTTPTTDAEGENNTTSDGAGVTSLVAATVTAAVLAVLF